MKQVTKLHKEFDKLQLIHWEKYLNSVYGCWDINSPKIMFVFMNPTSKNVATSKSWEGLKAPWLWVKNTWKMFHKLWIISEALKDKISSKRPEDWNYEFSEEVYKEIENSKFFITNICKATQIWATPMKDSEYREYLELMKEEISAVKPKAIVTFWNQVSSVLLWKQISVSNYRKAFETIDIWNETYKIYPIYYPVGQGMRNMPKAVEDINYILND